MMRLIRAEIVKLTTTKLVYWLALAIVGLTSLATVISLIRDSSGTMHLLSSPGGMAEALSSMATSFTVVPLILGLTAIPTEFRHGTITPAFLTRPRRGQLVAAKAVVYGASAAVMMAAAILSLAVIACAWALALGEHLPLLDAATWCFALRLIVSSVIVCLFGLGVGAALKNLVAAVTAGFIWAAIVEQLLASLLPRVGPWLPFTSGEIFDYGTKTASVGGDLPHWWVAGLVLAAYALVACIAGTYVLKRRDIA
jgi:ABC-2 type transport system permease protein